MHVGTMFSAVINELSSVIFQYRSTDTHNVTYSKSMKTYRPHMDPFTHVVTPRYSKDTVDADNFENFHFIEVETSMW